MAEIISLPIRQSRMIMPAGYMTLVDCTYSLLKFWDEDSFGFDTRKIDDAINEITALLCGEVIKAVGWDTITGELIPLPAIIFRTVGGVDLVKIRKPTLISKPIAKHTTAVIPIIDSHGLIATFKGFFPTIVKFDPFEWDFSTQDSLPSSDNKNDTRVVDTSIKKAGRPRKHDWDKFFHEVALHADGEGLANDGHPDELRKHMFQWAASNMTPNPPDNSQIKKKLKPIEEKWRQRNIG